MASRYAAPSTSRGWRTQSVVSKRHHGSYSTASSPRERVSMKVLQVTYRLSSLSALAGLSVLAVAPAVLAQTPSPQPPPVIQPLPPEPAPPRPAALPPAELQPAPLPPSEPPSDFPPPAPPFPPVAEGKHGHE